MNLRNPPAAHNAVRFLAGSVEATAKNIYRFQKGRPSLSYQRAYKAIHDRQHWGINADTMRRMVLSLKSEKGRGSNLELLNAYLEHESDLQFAGKPAFDDEFATFRVSAGLQLPIKPTAIVADDVRFNVLTVLGWSALKMTDHHKRLWMTIYEDALFTLEDFRSARGVFALYPKVNGVRELVYWERGDYEPVPLKQLDDELDMLSEAIKMAEGWIASERNS